MKNFNKNSKAAPAPAKESEEQIAFIKYCDLHNIIAFSTQNGMYMPKKTAFTTGGADVTNSSQSSFTPDGKKDFNHFAYINRQKAMGLRKGFPDIVVFAKNKSGTHEVLCIEMKRTEGGTVSKDQKEWIHRLDDADYCVGIAYGCEAAIRILHKYLEG